MRTPRRHRLTRRQSEQVLDGLGGPDDLTRLLADARPLRVDGELPGEAVAVAAFRSGAVAALDPQPRSSSVTTLSLSRALLVKVLAVATATFAVGGVALAASSGHLPGSHGPAPSASVTVAASHPSGDQDGSSDGKGSPSGRPSGSPTSPAHADELHAIGLCRAWDEVSGNTGANSPVNRAHAFQELQTRAGGSAKVASYCAALVTTWCESHRWPGATPVQIDGSTTVMRCVHPSTSPSGVPGGVPSSMPGGHTPPTHPGKPSNVPPTGAPIRN